MNVEMQLEQKMIPFVGLNWIGMRDKFFSNEPALFKEMSLRIWRTYRSLKHDSMELGIDLSIVVVDGVCMSWRLGLFVLVFDFQYF